MAASADGTSGRQFLGAVAAGYEAMARIGEATKPAAVLAGGFHPTMLFGGFGAAAAAAKLLGLDAPGLQMAWGHILSLSGGSMQFSDESAATDVKRLHAGYAARSGILAAQFAARGISAPLRALDGKYGLFALYGEGRLRQSEELGRPMSELAIHEVSFKPYSCCRLFHSAIDCIVGIQEHGDIKRDEVAAVVVRGPAVLGEQHMLRRPRSSMAAQYSLPYAVGATLAHGATGYHAYELPYLDDSETEQWSSLVRFKPDKVFEDRYPAHFGAGVDFLFKDGTVSSEDAMDGTGSPACPMDPGMFEQKARRLILERDPHFNIEQLKDALRKTGGTQSVIGLINLITKALP
jgi:2-methylcitrate dehydratase PrpD